MSHRPAHILHLSDLQFGSHSRFRNGHRYDGEKAHLVLLERLVEDLADIDSKFGVTPNVLVVSGDIAEQSLPEEYQLARDFFETLLAETQIPLDHVVILPGNHDVNWKVLQASRLMAEARGESFEPPYPQKFAMFAEFYDDLYGELRSFEHDLLYSCHPMPDVGLMVVALNSCIQESDKDHYGWIGTENLRNAGQAANEADVSKDLFRMCVTHHNFTRKSAFDNENLVDADELRPALLSFGFSCILHGHRHVGDMRIEKDPETGRELIVLATGSAGLDSETLPEIPNQYQVVSLAESGMLKCFLRRYSQQSIGVSGAGQWLADSTRHNTNGVVSIVCPDNKGPEGDFGDGSPSLKSSAEVSVMLDREVYAREASQLSFKVTFRPPQPIDQAEVSAEKVPVNHVVVLDVSGSMRRDDKYPYAEIALRSYVNLMRDEDTFSLVIFSHRVDVICWNEAAPDAKGEIAGIMTKVRQSPAFFGGATLLGKALAEVSVRCQDTPSTGRLVRTVGLTDGHVHDTADIDENIPHLDARGDSLFVIGLGSDFSAQPLGFGIQEYYPSAVRFLPTPEELQSVFEHFGRTATRVTGTSARASFEAAPVFTVTNAFALSPHDFPLTGVAGSGFSNNVGAIEYQKVYEYLVVGKLHPDTGAAECEVGEFLFDWCDVSGKTIKSNVAINTKRGLASNSDTKFQLWKDLLSRHSAKTRDDEVRALRARRTLLERERNADPRLIDAIDKQIDILTGKSTHTELSKEDEHLLDATEGSASIQISPAPRRPIK